jgi:GNAT superfamily N-acetyltransferase
MQLVEVTNPQLGKDFLEVNVAINKAFPNYIRPLDKDINDVFDEKKNKTFRFGSVVRWLLKDADGNYIGRIAAFTNKRYKNKGDDVPVGGIGFFDCINDQQAASLLFDTAKQWLQQQGMQAMDGPINFGERDRWWGLVTEGFQEPLYGMNFNPPYYQALFENYGFQRFFGQVCLGMDPKQKLGDKIFARHALYEKDRAFSVRNINKNELEKYAEDFTIVYNAAWAGHGGMKQLRKEQVVQMFKKMKPVMDERIIWFAYHNDKPIAIFVNLPDLNQWFKYLDGKFGLLHKLKFLWVKKTKPCKKFTGLVFGIIPEFQGKGIDAYLVGEAYKQVLKNPYTEYEMQWIGDFNPRMLNVAQGLGDVYRSRLLITYRYLFDRNKEFKPHPVL